jgi:hypothetical protein
MAYDQLCGSSAMRGWKPISEEQRLRNEAEYFRQCAERSDRKAAELEDNLARLQSEYGPKIK